SNDEKLSAFSSRCSAISNISSLPQPPTPATLHPPPFAFAFRMVLWHTHPMAEGKPRVFLIDGSSYIYRAFFAIPHLSNSKGFPTNATYGFTNMILKVLRDQAPEYLAIAFDAP